MALAACAHAAHPAPPGGVTRQPIVVSVKANRSGEALRLVVTGTGRGHHRGERFEDPRTWRVSVRANGHELQRLVNGPVRIARRQVGDAGDLWNVVVTFDVAFAAPPRPANFDVRVMAPDAAPVKLHLTNL